ncbi:MAG: hypothetical protein IH627_10820 [Rubrivivax sp.]|nr:hypothetical protein [Rubrivivax sp.]
MLNIYFNYPNGHVMVHCKQVCAAVRQQRKAGQRVVRIDGANLSSELQRFKLREYRFASTAAQNDLWLQIDLSDMELELAVVKHVHRQLSKNYKPFSRASVETHC